MNSRTTPRAAAMVIAVSAVLALSACGSGDLSQSEQIGSTATPTSDDSTLYTNDPNGSDEFTTTTITTATTDQTAEAAEQAEQAALEAQLEAELDQLIAEIDAMAGMANDIQRQLNDAAAAAAKGG